VTITVVGAGVIGCAIAHELASRGALVRIIDPRGTGQGATRASAGILAPHIEGHLPGLLTLARRSLELYDDFVRRVEVDARQAIEYARTGTLQVALDAGEVAELCAAAHVLHEQKVEHSVLDGREARRLEPALSEEVVGALLVPAHGYVAAGALTFALARAAAHRGAVMATARVLAVEGAERPRVTTGDESFDADAVIIAAGAWSPEVVPRARSRDARAGGGPPDPPQPRRGDAGGAPVQHGPMSGAHVKPIRGQLVQVKLPNRPAARVIWGSRCYVVPWRDGSVLVGATVEDVGFDERATSAGVQGLLAAGVRLVPALEGAAFEEVRVGLRPMTADELPAIGRSSTMSGVFHATGHYRNGVLLAPLTAALVADLVIDGRERPELALVRPDRLGV
jgi:glycine oxidase